MRCAQTLRDISFLRIRSSQYGLKRMQARKSPNMEELVILIFIDIALRA